MTQAIVHVVASLARRYGGPSYSVPSLCAAQARAGANVELCAVETVGDLPLEGVSAALFRHDLSRTPVLRQLHFSGGLRRQLNATAQSASIVHAHGLWLMPNVEAGLAARRYKVPLVVSARGMLAAESLRISPLRKRIFWTLLQGSAYGRAAAWHATCEAEAEEIRRFGIRAPIAIVPNGISLPVAGQSPAMRAEGKRTVLYLGRVHPKKALDTLVRAWTGVARDFPGWRLRIVGPDENGHAADLRELAAALQSEAISIEVPVFGKAKDELLAEASLFVLPTLNENFGIAVAEALAAGVPAIVTRGAPWAGLADERCGWWIDHGVGPLAAALRDAMQLPASTLREMGSRGRGWMARAFEWDPIARDLLGVYKWLCEGGDRPSTVTLGN
jgi:glycosyltransferase involved in cell wall biosynthesis